METGAYADAGPRVTQKAGYRCFGPYRIPHVKTDAYTVYTNTVPAGAYRGFGTLQVTWAYESQMDIIAEKLGMDPLEFRLKNLLKKGELYTPGDTPVDCDLKEGLLRAAKEIGWNKKDNKPNRGKGLACCMKDGGGTYKVASAAVKMNSDGSIILLTGTVEIGQGARTALSQIVAEELAVPLSRITVAELDTDVTPYDVNTNASSSTVVMGLSVQRAAQDLKRQLLRHGAKVLKRPPIDWRSSMDESKTPRDKAFPSKASCTKFFHRRAVKSLDAGPTKTSKVKRRPWALPRLFGRSLGVERKLRSIATPAKLN